MMKKSVYIFLFYLLINTVVPCFLYSTCCAGANNSDAVLVTAGCEDGHEDCSPFFNCSQCLSKFLQQKNISGSEEIGSGSYFTLNPDRNPSYTTQGIFQPPRIS